MFLRFATSQVDPHSGWHRGVFQAAFRLRDSVESSEHLARLLGITAWFNECLKRPDRLTVSRRRPPLADTPT